MISFTSKEIKSDLTVGERLKQAREAMNLSYDVVEKFTHIHRYYIELLERGDYNRLPGSVYTESFLKKYSQFLGLNFEHLHDLYKKESSLLEVSQKRGSRDVRHRIPTHISKTYFLITPKIFKRVCFIAACLILVSYLGFKVWYIIKPPILTIYSPQDNVVTDRHFVWVEGMTEKEVSLTINSREVLADTDGYFKERLDLHSGLNVIKVSVKKKHSRENVVLRRILVVEEDDGENYVTSVK